jgi:transcriptional regulator with XRE-family HTH domain
MQLRDLSQSAIGRALGCSQNSVSLWCRGLSRPEPPYREALELWLGIPMRTWDTAEESSFLIRFREWVADSANAGRPEVG